MQCITGTYNYLIKDVISELNGLVLLAKKRITLPSFPIRYLQKFQVGLSAQPPFNLALHNHWYKGWVSDPLTEIFSSIKNETPYRVPGLQNYLPEFQLQQY